MQLSAEEYRSYGKEIRPDFLYLASKFDAEDPEFLKKHKITHILNVAEECEPAAESQSKGAIKVKHIQLRDSPRTILRNHFDGAFSFVDSAKKAKGRCLVHCFEGRNRSAAFVIGYLMHSEKWPLAKALQEVRLVRRLVDPNVGFRKQLCDLERELFKQGPSWSMTQEEVSDLLDMDIIKLADLKLYTDLPFVQYEDQWLQAGSNAAAGGGKAAAKALSAPASTSAVARGGSKPTPQAASKGVRSPAAKSRSKYPPPGARRPSNNSASATGSEPAVPIDAKLQTALSTLFDALDTSVCFFLSLDQLKRAAALLVTLKNGGDGNPDDASAKEVEEVLKALQGKGNASKKGTDTATAAELFRRCDSNSDGLITRAEVAMGFREVLGRNVESKEVDSVFCSADDDRDGKLTPAEFNKWFLESTDDSAKLLNTCIGHETFGRRVAALTKGWKVPAEGKALASQLEALAHREKPPHAPAIFGPDEDRAKLSEVLPGHLILTNWRAAADAEAVSSKSVSHIVCVGAEFENEEPHAKAGIKYLNIVVTDDEEQEVLPGQEVNLWALHENPLPSVHN